MATLLPNGRMQICGYSGTPAVWGPLVGGLIYTYAAGTSTPKATYTTAAASVQNENPVVLDARGEATIFWSGAYKIVVRDADDNILYTVDNVTTDISASAVTYAGETLAFILLNNISHVVNSIAELRDVEKTDYTMCFVKGYYAAGDGGGGSYYYDSGDTTTADNGGSVIVAADTGRWKLLNNGQPYSVLQFGAINDAATDSTAFIQDAIDAAEADGVFAVTIDGAFVVNSDITTEKVDLIGRSDKYLLDLNFNGLADLSSVILLKQTASINLWGGMRFEKITVAPQSFYNGGAYAVPFVDSTVANAALATFSGTAIDALGYSPVVKDCTIMGYEYGIISGGSIQGCDIDCVNGIDLVSGGTLHRDNNIYPFTTLGMVGAVQSRNGYAADYTDAPNLANCVHNGYKLGTLYGSGSIDTCSFGAPEAATASALSIVNAGIVTVRSTGIGTYDVNDYPVSVATDCTYVFDGCIFSNNALTHAIDLAAGASYGHVISCKTNTTSFVGGDATAVKKCTITTPWQAHTPVAWTPVLTIGGVTTGITYGTQTAVAVIGDNIAYVSGTITLTSKGAATGGCTITGLPFPVSAVAGSGGGGVLLRYSSMASLAGVPYCAVVASGVEISLYLADLSGTGTNSVTNTYLQNNSSFSFAFSYPIDR